MEDYFSKFRKHIIGINQKIQTPIHDEVPIVYADWTASGRSYGPIEDKIRQVILPYVANTHTDTNYTGMATTHAYHEAKEIIKKRVNASEEDIIISSNSGMTGVINKFQRILGLKIHEFYKSQIKFKTDEKPIVFITHMEHHSNQTSWLETIADVEIIPPDETGLVSLINFENLLQKHKSRKFKIAAITSCSNVTGIITPFHEMAELIHRYNGVCFVDFACSAPYVNINMHPKEHGAHLDAIYFSPHKFIGGPGSSGILIFNKQLYSNSIPDEPGGGTVDWTNPWGQHKYIDDIEMREDGGTPAFIQTIRTALCMQLKETMGVENIIKRESEQMKMIWEGLSDVLNLHILADQHKNRLSIISFYIDDLHYIAGVKMLNDQFGIQTRGGCSCAGTYGHYLLNVDPSKSNEITDLISKGDNSHKPGWIRMSIHPTSTNEEINYIIDCIKSLAVNHSKWMENYIFDKKKNSIRYKDNKIEEKIIEHIEGCFNNDFY